MRFMNLLPLVLLLVFVHKPVVKSQRVESKSEQEVIKQRCGMRLADLVVRVSDSRSRDRRLTLGR